jgi:hypothetical protein
MFRVALALAGALACAAGQADTPPRASNQPAQKVKSSSFAPRPSHGRAHVYGAPISKPVLARRKRAAHHPNTVGNPQPAPAAH